MLEQISDFLSAGGKVLWLILFVLTALWFFILERFYYFYKIYPDRKKELIKKWKNKKDKTSFFALKIRQEEISKVTQDMTKFISSMKTCLVVSPLLGLMGTVTGMISIFDVISFSGTGSPRLMAAGISLAVIPTMAGLITALSGFYFFSFFEKKGEKEKEKITEELNVGII